MRRSRRCVLFAALASLALPTVLEASALADGVEKVVITLPPVDVYGRAKTPLASIEVSKAIAKLPLRELRSPIIDRIDASARSHAL